MKSILLIGLGRFGQEIAEQFYDLGLEVMGVEQNEELVNEALPMLTNAQIGDATNPAFLKSLGVSSYDVCIVTIAQDFQSSLEVTSLLKELGGQLVVSRSDSDRQTKFLLRNGADEVINPEKQVAKWAAIKYSSEQIFDYIQLDEDHAIYEVAVPDDWDGVLVKQLEIRKKYGLNILATKDGKDIDFNVMPDTVMKRGTSMLVMGEYKSVRKCFRL